MVVPSDEDSQTFQVNFASGESYKLRAANVKDRQVWVDRIRAVAHRHESAMARDHAPPIGMIFGDLISGAALEAGPWTQEFLEGFTK